MNRSSRPSRIFTEEWTQSRTLDAHDTAATFVQTLAFFGPAIAHAHLFPAVAVRSNAPSAFCCKVLYY